MQLFKSYCPATLQDVSLTRRAMRRALSEIRMSGELIDDFQLIMSEIAVNSLEHSVKGPSQFEFNVYIRGAEIGLEIVDDGSPFEEFDNKFGIFAPELEGIKGVHSASSESGRGIELVRDFADDIVYRPGPPNHFLAWRRLFKRKPIVLIVEDEAVLAETYALALYPTYRTISVDSVKGALAILNETSIDLVIVDYHLADGTGRQLAEIMETEPDRLPVPIIMISGDDDEDLRREMLEIGIDATLQKPISIKQLESQVALSLNRAERRRTSHFRHFGVAAAKLLTDKMPERLGQFDLAQHTNVADLGSGDVMLHLAGRERERVVLMDVMGHGLGAHAAAIALAAITRAVHALHLGKALPHFFKALSNALFADLTLGQLISTMLVVDLKFDGELEVGSAGHPNPVLVRPGAIEKLDVSGPLLGFVPDAFYETRTLRLKSGERLVCFTDGLDPHGLSAGEALPNWLNDALQNRLSIPLNQGIDGLLDDVRAKIGPEPNDDWTLLLVENSA